MPNKKQRYCFCEPKIEQQNKNSFMIACDNCENWYHGTCVNVTPQAAKKINKYFCHICQDQHPELRSDTVKKTPKERRLSAPLFPAHATKTTPVFTSGRKRKRCESVTKSASFSCSSLTVNQPNKSNYDTPKVSKTPSKMPLPSEIGSVNRRLDFGDILKSMIKRPQLSKSVRNTVTQFNQNQSPISQQPTISENEEAVPYSLGPKGSDEVNNLGVEETNTKKTHMHFLKRIKDRWENENSNNPQNLTQSSGDSGGGSLSVSEENSRTTTCSSSYDSILTDTSSEEEPNVTDSKVKLFSFVRCFAAGCNWKVEDEFTFCSEKCDEVTAIHHAKQLCASWSFEEIQEPADSCNRAAKEEKTWIFLLKVRAQLERCTNHLNRLNRRRIDLDGFIEFQKLYGRSENRNTTASTHYEPDVNQTTTVRCIICKCCFELGKFVRHAKYCLTKEQKKYFLHSNTSFIPTSEGATAVICGKFLYRNEVRYCKRLKVLCGKHSLKLTILLGKKPCGYPNDWTNYEKYDWMLPSSEKPKFCRKNKQTCRVHDQWEKVLRVDLDIRRYKQSNAIADLRKVEWKLLNYSSNRKNLSVFISSGYDVFTYLQNLTNADRRTDQENKLKVGDLVKINTL